MKWFDGNYNLDSIKIPYPLLYVDKDIYDELIEKEDGCYLIKRCGIEKYYVTHKHTKFITNGIYIIYALPANEVKQIKVADSLVELFGGTTYINFISDYNPSIIAKAKVDRRYIDRRIFVTNKNFNINTLKINVKKEIYINSITFEEELLSNQFSINYSNSTNTILQDIIELPFDKEILKPPNFIEWNESNKSYDLLDSSNRKLISRNFRDKIKFNIPQGTEEIVSDLKLEISTSTRIPRILTPPTSLSAFIENDTTIVSWNHIPGAEKYNVYLNDNLVSSTEYNGYKTDFEYEGYIKVKSVNALMESDFSEELYVKTTPNETYISFIDNTYENGNHVIKINFSDYSNIETNYKIVWNIDDRADEFVTLNGSANTGELYTYTLKIPSITQNIALRIISINEIGQNDILKPMVLNIGPNIRWKYNESTSTVLLEWKHAFPDANYYRLKYIKNGLETFEDVFSDSASTTNSSIKHYISLEDDEELTLSITPVINNQVHIYSKPINISKALDTTLKPLELIYKKISDLKYEFTFKDIYTCEKEFEVIFNFNDKITREIIKSVSEMTQGKQYYFEYEFKEIGTLNVQVKMNWDLGSSPLSNRLTLYNVPASGLPVSFISQKRITNGYRIEWEGQQYVKNYEVSKNINTQEETLITTSNSIDIPYELNETEIGGYVPGDDLNYWKLSFYRRGTDQGKPNKEWFKNINPYKELNVLDVELTSKREYDEQYLCYAIAYVFVDKDYTQINRIITDDDGCVYFNDEKIAETVTAGAAVNCNLEFKKGWNKIEVIYREFNGGDYFYFQMPISTDKNIQYLTYKKPTISDRLNTINIKVKTHFLNDIVSEWSTPKIFTPEIKSGQNKMTLINNYHENYSFDGKTILKDCDMPYQFLLKSTSKVKIDYSVNTKAYTQYTLSQFPYATEFTGKELETPYIFEGHIVDSKSIQSENMYVQKSILETFDERKVGTYVETLCILENKVNTEINKVRIMTIGDSITAGHPNFWAETMTGNIYSQYQYWLNRRLKNQFEIINKGYGSDTTDRTLKRFDEAVKDSNASYCIVQCGTNDIYWAMAEDNGNQETLNRKLQTMKDNMLEMIKRCWKYGMKPIVGTLIPRTGATGIYKDALYDYNEWIIDFCNKNENISYVDFFNAGKEKIPPTPLEDPKNPGALNPIYDGDAIYDEYGNLIKQGRGIHPSPEGYKIMGESIPLSLFQTFESGLKMYLDSNCTVEENYNDQDKVNPFYTITFNNVRRGKTKTIVRYIKNIGINQTLFSMYTEKPHNLKIWFLDKDGNKTEFTNGMLNPNMSAKVVIEIDVLYEDNNASVKFHLVGREIK